MAAESFNKGHKVCNRQKEHRTVRMSENLGDWGLSSIEGHLKFMYSKKSTKI
jgi:hypothetical protein